LKQFAIIVAMTADTFREILKRKPFEPISIVMSSGESYDVLHPEWIFVTPRSLVLSIPDETHPEGSRLAFCSYLHLAHVEVLEAKKISRRRAG